MKKEKEKILKSKLKNWGGTKNWLKMKKKEYIEYSELYERGEDSCLVDDAVLFECKAEAEKVFHDIRDHFYEKSEIDAAISTLDPLEKEVIISRYAKQLKWEYIPAHIPIQISLRHCHRLHKTALEKIDDYLNKVHKDNV